MKIQQFHYIQLTPLNWDVPCYLHCIISVSDFVYLLLSLYYVSYFRRP